MAEQKKEGEEDTCPDSSIDGQDPGKSELRIILMGSKRTGKSATGNTLLGDPVFKSKVSPNAVTKTCGKVTGSWNGKNVLVIDTPAIFSSEVPDDGASREVANCIRISFPGPHAVLFVTQLGCFTEEDSAAVKRVKEIWGKEVMMYVVVLFTHKEDLEGDSLSDYIKDCDNKDLQELVRECGNRCCAFNNKATGAEREAQVRELMGLVERMVQENGDGCYTSEIYKHTGEKIQEQERALEQYCREIEEFVMKRRQLKDLEKLMREFDTNPKELEKKVRKPVFEALVELQKYKKIKEAELKENLLRELEKLYQGILNCSREAAKNDFSTNPEKKDDEHEPKQGPENSSLSEWKIILAGKTGVGKSATGNSILIAEVFESKLGAKSVTKTCKAGSRRWNQREVVVIDTPDIFDPMTCSNETYQEIIHCIELSSPGPHALVLVTQLGRFTEEETAAVRRVKEIFGVEAMKRVIVLFTRREDLGDGSLHEYITDSENENLWKLIQECGGRFCAFNNKAIGEELNTQVGELMELVERVVRQNGGQCYTNELYSDVQGALDDASRESGQKHRLTEDRVREYMEKQRMMAEAENPSLLTRCKRKLGEAITTRVNFVRNERPQQISTDIVGHKKGKCEPPKQETSSHPEGNTAAMGTTHVTTGVLTQVGNEGQQQCEQAQHQSLSAPGVD